MEEIYSRRSIREYTDEKIPDAVLDRILKAGMNAPSARNLKPYEFVIVRNKNSLTELSLIKKHAYMVKESDAAIVVLGKQDSEFWQLDLGATIQNILLEATHLGVGSCWVGINQVQMELLRQKLNIPNDIYPISMISLGYPKENKNQNNNYYEDKIRHEKY